MSTKTFEDLLSTACGTKDPLHLLLRGGGVTRYHTEGLSIRQTVAEHTWRVMVILLHLWPRASDKLLRTALYHDVAEGLVGDIPAPVKRNPDVSSVINSIDNEFMTYVRVENEDSLHELDYARLKCADYLELCLTCSIEIYGPKANRIFENGAKYVEAAAAKLLDSEEERNVLQLLSNIKAIRNNSGESGA